MAIDYKAFKELFIISGQEKTKKGKTGTQETRAACVAKQVANNVLKKMKTGKE